MSFNRSYGSYFLYWDVRNKKYFYRCRFCDDWLKNEDSWVYIKYPGGLSRIKCCHKEECKEMAVIVGLWDLPGPSGTSFAFPFSPLGVEDEI